MYGVTHKKGITICIYISYYYSEKISSLYEYIVHKYILLNKIIIGQ